MARQVLQVKRKNSTNWTCPEARLTVEGSVAWSSGPREVVTTGAVEAGASVDAASAVGEGSSTEGAALGCATTVGTAGCADEVSVAALGAQAASSTASRLRLRRLALTTAGRVEARRVLISISRVYIRKFLRKDYGSYGGHPRFGCAVPKTDGFAPQKSAGTSQRERIFVTLTLVKSWTIL